MINVIDRLFRKFGYTRNVGGLGSTGFFPSGVSRVSNDTALKFTAVFSAIRIRSENIASLPKRIYKQGRDGKLQEDKHPASVVIRSSPNNYMNSFTFWEYMNSCLDGWGNAYAIIESDGRGYPRALHPVHPSEVIINLTNGEKTYKVTNKDFAGVYTDGEMCHFFSLSKDGIKGINPITYNSEAIGLGIAATKYGISFFENGGNVKAVMETDKMMNDKAYKRLKEMKMENHSTLILEDGVKYKIVGIAPEAAQMLQTKLFSIQDISRIFNVPPHMLADLSHANYSTIEQQNILFGQYSLRPAVKLYEVELERKLFLPKENYSVKFDLRGLMRGDSSARANFYNTMLQNGVMNRNEVRIAEGYNRMDGLDDFLIALNMGQNQQQPNKKEEK